MKRTAVLATHALLLAMLLSIAAAGAATPQSTAFTYQGNLNASGHPASGNFDLQFKLFDAETGGAQVGATITLTQYPVANGIFTADLDFPGVFAGNQRWLEVTVGTQTLSPRQPVNSVPVAEFALSGNSGPPGARGYTSLIGLTPELPGTNCIGGGTKIATGADVNANGVLDVGEVTATSYLCNIVAPVLPAQCNAYPLGWGNPAIDYTFSDPDSSSSWSLPNTGSFVTLAAHPVDANTCGTLALTPYSYSWSLFSAPAGSTAQLSGATNANPVFIPDVAGAYVIQSIARDALGNTTPPTYLTVTTSSCGVNPITVFALQGAPQNLSTLTNSDDADSSKCPSRFTPSFTYAWSVLSAPARATWQFTSPNLGVTSFVPTLAGSYLVGVKVTGSGGQAGSNSISLVLGGGDGFPELQADVDPTVAGQSVTFTAILQQWRNAPPFYLGPPTGSVTFFDGATEIAGCITLPLILSSPFNVCTTSSLTSGAHSIRVLYSGDETFTATYSYPLSHTVN